MAWKRKNESLGEFGVWGEDMPALTAEDAETHISAPDADTEPDALEPEKTGEMLPQDTAADAQRMQRESPHTWWLQDLKESSENRMLFNKMLGDAYVHPQVGLNLVGIIISNYQVIRHGLSGWPEQKEMDMKIAALHIFAKNLGAAIMYGKGEQGVNMEVYYQMLDLEQDIWNSISVYAKDLRLGIPFKVASKWKMALRSVKKASTAISDEDSKNPLPKKVGRPRKEIPVEEPKKEGEDAKTEQEPESVSSGIPDEQNP